MKSRLSLAVAVAIASAVPVLAPVAAPIAGAVSCTLTTKLSPGVTDPAVNCLEQRLLELGYTGITGPDNTYDAGTATAVKAYQTSRGLYPDGIVTSITSRQLGLRGTLPPAGAAKISILGDSTSAAMRWYDEANNNTVRYDIMGNDYDLLWSTESCRRLVAVSCTGRTDPGTGHKWVPVSVLPLMQGTLKGKLGEAIVIMAGYDDTSITNAIDPIMAEAKAQGVSRVFWLTYRTTTVYHYGTYYAAGNAALEAAKVRHPNLTVLDWNGFTKSQPSSVQSAWMESDGIHLKSAGASALATWLKSNIDTWHTERCKAVNATTGGLDTTTGTPTAESTNLLFTGVAPQRVLDTRQSITGRVGAGRRVTIDLDAVLPAEAPAVALSVTAVDPCAGGYLTVFDCDVRPGTSNLNYVAGRTTAGLAITHQTDRTVCVYSSAATDLIVDVTGVFATTGSVFHTLSPTRWVDTRGNAAVLGTITGVRAAGSDTEVQLAGTGDVPANATAVWLNVTGVSAQGTTYLTVYPGPCGSAPLSSNVNLLANRTASSAVLVAIGSNGAVCVRTGGSATHLVIDVAGWFQPGTDGLSFNATPALRLYDSRPGTPPPANTVHQVTTGGVAVLSVVSVLAGAPGFVTVKPCGDTGTSSLINNYATETFANTTAIAPGTGSAVCATGSMATHVVVDQTGTFTPFVPA